MLRECAKFPNDAVKEPGDNTGHCVCGVLGRARICLSVLGPALLQLLASAGMQGAFPGLTAVLTSGSSYQALLHYHT